MSTPDRIKEADLFVSLYDKIIEKEGQTDLRDISEVKASHEKRYDQEPIQQS